MTVVLGVDIGQSQDPTAVCVAEAEPRAGGAVHWLVRHLERLRLGTPYPEVVQRLDTLTWRTARTTGQRPRLLVDSTGVGKPVVDRLRRLDLPADLWAVHFTGGSRCALDRARQRLTVGKRHLVHRLEVALEQGRVHLPQLPEARALARELQTYERRIDSNGGVRLGAFRAGTNDDLLTALCLAVLSLEV